MAARTPRASCTTILIARPIRLFLATIILFCVVASLRWHPSAAMSETVSNYFNPEDATPQAGYGTAFDEDDEDVTDRRPGSDGRSGWADTKPLPKTRPELPGDKSMAYVEEVSIQKQHSVPPETSPFAYVFYATQDAYACSVLVNVDRLQNKLKVKYPIYVLVTAGVSQPYIEAFKSMNVVVSTQNFPSVAEGSSSNSRGSLVKLLAFKMHHVNSALKRIIALDSDQLVLKNLDHLFEGMPPADLAAPRAYWAGKDTISTTFMLIRLSDRLWATMEPAIKNAPGGRNDTELVNELLGENVLILPGDFITMNSHWETWGIPKWYNDDSAATANAQQTSVAAVSSATPLPASQQKGTEALPRLPSGKGIEVKTEDDGSPSAYKLVKRDDEDDYMMDGESHAPHNAPSRPVSFLPHQEPPKPAIAPAPSLQELERIHGVKKPLDADSAVNATETQDQPAAVPSAIIDPMKSQRPNFQKLYDVYDSASLLHFSSLGKPWSWSYAEAQSSRADAHPLFYEQYREWRTAAIELCPSGVIEAI